MNNNDVRTTATGLLNYGKAYIDAADIVEKSGVRLSYCAPKFFLIGHGLELTFKAFACFKGVSIDDIARKPYAHDLDSMLIECDELGVNFTYTDTEKQHITLLRDYYGPPYEVRYIRTGYYIAQNSELLIDLGRRLFCHLKPIIWPPTP